MKKMVQLYTGGIGGRGITCGEISHKLKEFGGKKPDGIIAGWSLDREIYRWLREYTAQNDMEFYLWFQTLSEYKRLRDFAPVRDIEGKPVAARVFDGDEEFSFCCPGSKKTLDYLKEIYEEYFDGIGFDGVFMDRIRFPSPSMDKRALFSCCCSDCMKKYRQHGIEKEDILKLKKRVCEDNGGDNIFGIEEYRNGRYVFGEEKLECYLAAREAVITDLVSGLSVYFREKGMKVGLDLFAPFLSPFVGQSYEELGRLVDFIKPMLYRYTKTPAAMEYELRGMVGALSRHEAAEKRICSFREKVGANESDWTEFMVKEVKNAGAMTDCRLYIGMEIHTILECELIPPQKIAEGVKRLEEMEVAGRIASWNLLAAGKDNIRAFMGKERAFSQKEGV